MKNIICITGLSFLLLFVSTFSSMSQGYVVVPADTLEVNDKKVNDQNRLDSLKKAAREAEQVEQNAKEASKESKKALNAEKKAQKARQQADEQNKKANQAIEKSETR